MYDIGTKKHGTRHDVNRNGLTSYQNVFLKDRNAKMAFVDMFRTEAFNPQDDQNYGIKLHKSMPILNLFIIEISIIR